MPSACLSSSSSHGRRPVPSAVSLPLAAIGLRPGPAPAGAGHGHGVTVGQLPVQWAPHHASLRQWAEGALSNLTTAGRDWLHVALLPSWYPHP
jgi:hypothetical protein